MFSQSADKPAADQPDAPAGMRELPPQPAKPVMPGYAPTAPVMPPVPDAPAGMRELPPQPAKPVMPGYTPTSPAAPAPEPELQVADGAPGPDDSVIAVDDHLEGTFTSRGTVVVKGSVKGRIEAVQIRIEDGASVDADVIVDEAIIAGEFTGNLTCRERLEARSSGRISGRVETFKLMLHEGASVEGEMHMLTEAPRDASETIRGTATLRGDGDQPKLPAKPAAPAAKPAPAPSVQPASAVGSSSAVNAGNAGSADAVRSSVVDTLKAGSAPVVTPRTSTTTRGYGYSTRSGAASSKSESKGTTGF